MRKIRITDAHEYGDKKVVVFDTEAPNGEATFAFVLLEKWGPILATEDGEDAAGRQKLRSLTPQEIVNKAFDIAAAAMVTARERGLMIACPDLNEINAEHDEKRALDRIEKDARSKPRVPA